MKASWTMASYMEADAVLALLGEVLVEVSCRISVIKHGPFDGVGGCLLMRMLPFPNGEIGAHRVSLGFGSFKPSRES
jgi:hypothetical protein